MAVLAAVEESKTEKNKHAKDEREDQIDEGKDGWGDNRVRMDGATIG